LDRSDAGGFHRRAWHQGHQFAEITPIQRQIGHQLLVYDLAQHVASTVDQRTFVSDRNLLLPSLHLCQIEVRGGIEADIHGDVLRHRVKVRSLRHYHVPSRGQFRQDVTTVGAGHRFTDKTRGTTLGRYLRPRHHAAAGIHHVAANRATITLRQDKTRHEQQHGRRD
jgi:hypothetical protein